MQTLLDEVIAGTENTDVSRKVHILYEGRTWDLDFDSIDVGMLSADADIRNKVAEALDVPAIKLANFNVARNEETQDVMLTPNAVFGSYPY